MNTNIIYKLFKNLKNIYLKNKTNLKKRLKINITLS